MPDQNIIVYTDGSCNPVVKIGGWAAILIISNEKIVLKGKEENTTHQRMELFALLNALEYVQKNNLLDQPIGVFTDSQYIVQIPQRRNQLATKNYITKKGNPIQNQDLVTQLISFLDLMSITFTKVVAHQNKSSSPNLNREVDILARSIVRENVNE